MELCMGQKTAKLAEPIMEPPRIRPGLKMKATRALAKYEELINLIPALC